MNINEKLKYSELNSVYGRLLTDHQSELLRLYFDLDISLAELSEQFGISRQAARDAIVRGQKSLIEFESKLGIIDKRNRLKALAEELSAIVTGGDAKTAVSRLSRLAGEFYEEE